MRFWRNPWSQGLISNFLIVAVGFASGVLIARSVGPQGRGQLGVIVLWPQVVHTLLFFSLSTVMVRDLARTPDDQQVRHAMDNAVLLAAILTSTAFVLSTVFLPRHIDGHIREAAVIFGLLFCILESLKLRNLAIEASRQNFSTYHQARLLQPFAYTICVASVQIVTGLDVIGAIVCALIALVSSVAWQFYRDKRRFAGLAIREGVKYLRSAVPVHATNLLQILFVNADKLAASVMFSASEAGKYFVAQALAGAPLIILLTLQQTALPILASTDKTAVALRMQRYVLMCSLLAGVVCIGLAAVFYPTFGAIYGREFSGAAPIFLILLAASVPYTARQAIMVALRAHAFERAAAVTEGATIVTFALSTVTLRGHAALGVSLSIVIANAVGLAIAIYFAASKFNAHLSGFVSGAAFMEAVRSLRRFGATFKQAR